MISSLVFVVALVFNVGPSVASFSYLSNNTITFGHRALRDRLLIRRAVFAPKNNNWFRTQEETFFLPLDSHVITQIRVRDTKPAPPYGKCKIVDGGPGNTTVTLRFKSQINQAIRSIVHLYGFWTNFFISKAPNFDNTKLEKLVEKFN